VCLTQTINSQQVLVSTMSLQSVSANALPEINLLLLKTQSVSAASNHDNRLMLMNIGCVTGEHQKIKRRV